MTKVETRIFDRRMSTRKVAILPDFVLLCSYPLYRPTTSFNSVISYCLYEITLRAA